MLTRAAALRSAKRCAVVVGLAARSTFLFVVQWRRRRDTERAILELFHSRGESAHAERTLIEHALGRRLTPGWVKRLGQYISVNSPTPFDEAVKPEPKRRKWRAW